MSEGLELARMTWPEVREAIDGGMDTAVLAVGSTEQHGPHLPFATDTLLGEALCRRIAPAIGGVLIVPPIHLGFSDIHMEFPGSLTVPPDTLSRVVQACCDSLMRHGLRRIVIVPSHGGNFGWVRETVSRLQERPDGQRMLAFTDWPKLREAFGAVMAQDGLGFDGPGLHAGEVETSMMLHLHPDLVHMDRAQCGCMASSGDGRPYSSSIKEASPIGVLGDPRRASADRGGAYLDEWTRLIVEMVRAEAQPKEVA
jgi:creatinine amidohydrolase